MPSSLFPFGLKPVVNTVGLARPYAFPATSYIGGTVQKNYDTTAGVTFAQGAPVGLNSAGQIINAASVAGAATNTQVYGVFWGCEYIDTQGRFTKSTWYQDTFATSATGVDPKVVFYIITDLVNTTFDIQVEGTFANSNIVGGEFNFSATAGRTPGSYLSAGTESAISLCALQNTEVASATQGQVRVLGLSNVQAFAGGQTNYWNDAYPIVTVQIANTSSLTPKPNL